MNTKKKQAQGITDFQNKKRNEKKEKERIEKERIKKEKAAQAANQAKVEAYTGRPMSDYRQSRPSSEQNYTGGDTNSNPSTPGAQDSFSNKSGMGRTGYEDGGLASMFTRRR